MASGGSFDLSLADASFVGENANDLSGYSVSSAGDVDGDGLDDLLIGAYGNDDEGNYAGKTYLIFGSTVAAGGSFNLSQADAAFVGEDTPVMVLWGAALLGVGAALSATYYLVRSRHSGQ